MKAIGKLEKVELRDIWKKEAKDFTQWLEQNLDILGECLDKELSSLGREKAAGAFSADLTAEDSNSSMIIIENQLEKTNHDHLGKMITYLTNLEAKGAIWICKEARPEHVKAVSWLNEVTPDDISLYLVKIEAVRIGNSPPAPLFTVVAGPSEESKEAGTKKKEFARRHILRMEFWKRLLDKAREKTELHSNVKPSRYSYTPTGAGISGLQYSYVIGKNRGSVEIYIDRGKGFSEENKRIFDALHRRRKQIENEFGGFLNWERLDDKRASRISIAFPEAGLNNEDKWDELQDKMIDAMIRFEKALRKHIKKLPR